MSEQLSEERDIIGEIIHKNRHFDRTDRERIVPIDSDILVEIEMALNFSERLYAEYNGYRCLVLSVLGRNLLFLPVYEWSKWRKKGRTPEAEMEYQKMIKEAEEAMDNKDGMI